jgi:hypothetical protein
MTTNQVKSQILEMIENNRNQTGIVPQSLLEAFDSVKETKLRVTLDTATLGYKKSLTLVCYVTLVEYISIGGYGMFDNALIGQKVVDVADMSSIEIESDFPEYDYNDLIDEIDKGHDTRHVWINAFWEHIRSVAKSSAVNYWIYNNKQTTIACPKRVEIV